MRLVSTTSPERLREAPLPGRRRLIRRALLRMAVAAGTFLLCLIGAEFVARVVIKDVYVLRRPSDGGLFIPYNPGARAELLRDEFRNEYAINSLGFRDRLDRTQDRAPGKKRVVILGDSFSAGWGVEFRETYGFLLEEELGTEFVNTAKNGGSPLWYVPQARYFIEHLRPDLLLVQLFDNDLNDNMVKRDQFGVGDDGRMGPVPDRFLPDGGPGTRVSHWWNDLRLRRSYKSLRAWVTGREHFVQAFVESGSFAGRKVLTRDEALAKFSVDFSPDRPWDGDFSFYDPANASTWELPFQVHRGLLTQLLQETRDANVPVAVLYIPYYQVFLRPTRPANPHFELLRELCAANGALLIDATEVLGAAEDVLLLHHAYDGHLNAAGHAQLARDLSPRLQSAFPGLFGG